MLLHDSRIKKVEVKRCNCFQSIVNLGELPTSRGASKTWGVTGGSRVTVINRNAVCSEGKYNNQLSHVVNYISYFSYYLNMEYF